MKKKYGIAFLTLCVGLAGVNAQEVELGLEQRNRGEIGRGYKGSFGDNGGVGGVILNRTRINVGFNSSHVDAKVTLQNSGMWGQSDKGSSNNDVVVYESYATVKFGHGIAFKAGRQELKYDEGRILSSPKWGNAGTSHDAMILSFTNDDLKFHVGGAYNNDNKNQEFYKTDVYGLASNKWYRSMVYGWGHYRFCKKAGLSLLYLNEGLLGETGKTHYRSTFGGQMDVCLGAFAATLSGYGQSGRNYKDEKEGGFLLAGTASYKFSKKLGIKVGYDYYSNERDGHKGFTWLYGSPHNFAGYMDFWLDNLNTVNGLNDVYAGIFGKLKDLSYALDYHNFRMTEEFADNTGLGLGNELDLTLSYPVKDWVSVDVGASVYVLTDASRSVKQTTVDAASFGYVTLTVKPSAMKWAIKKHK